VLATLGSCFAGKAEGFGGECEGRGVECSGGVWGPLLVGLGTGDMSGFTSGVAVAECAKGTDCTLEEEEAGSKTGTPEGREEERRGDWEEEEGKERRVPLWRKFSTCGLSGLA